MHSSCINKKTQLTGASEKHRLVVRIDEFTVRDSSVTKIADRKCTQPAALLPVPHTAQTQFKSRTQLCSTNAI